MWISENMKKSAENTLPMEAVVTISQSDTAVYTDGEERGVKIISVPGIGWRPKQGDEMLVIKDSEGKKNILGGEQKTPPEEISPGEIIIYSNGGSVIIKNSGEVHISGNLYVDGYVYSSGGYFPSGTKDE